MSSPTKAVVGIGLLGALVAASGCCRCPPQIVTAVASAVAHDPVQLTSDQPQPIQGMEATVSVTEPSAVAVTFCAESQVRYAKMILSATIGGTMALPGEVTFDQDYLDYADQLADSKDRFRAHCFTWWMSGVDLGDHEVIVTGRIAMVTSPMEATLRLRTLVVEVFHEPLSAGVAAP